MRGLLIVAACAAGVAACGSGSPTSPGGSGGGPDTGIVYAGSFHPVEDNGQGMAQVYTNQDGSSEVRFTSDFATDSGPQLEVWLVSASDPMDNQSVLNAQHVSLGPLKSTSGAQTYAVPSGTTLSDYKSVTVWCVHFKVNFTTAPLARQ